MTQYTITGMSCAACSARVEKAVSGVSGVTSCSVSLLTNSMGVEGTAASSDIIQAVEAAGYGAAPKGESSRSADTKDNYSQMLDDLKDRETPVLKKRLISSIGFLAVLMYISMGHHMFGLPAPSFIAHNSLSNALTQMLLALIVMWINQKFFISGFKSLIKGAPNMDTLVAMGSFASFAYSTYVIFLMSDMAFKGDPAGAHIHLEELYFESAATILTLITVGKMLEARSKGRTTDALKGLMNLSPKQARVIRDGAELTIPAADVVKGDIFIVKPGESIPVDGTVLEGSSAVDESALSGESIPVDKSENDRIFAATINNAGYLRARADGVGADTALGRIIQMVSDAAATKAPIAKIADKVSGIFVPTVICIAIVTFVIWMAAGYGLYFAIARSISVLVISCPCALGLATPVAIMVGSGVGAKNGILFKTASALEATGKTDIAVLDKTGTITGGCPVVTDVIAYDERLLETAAALESKSEHPLAKAVMDYALENNIKVSKISDFAAKPGNGLSGCIDSIPVCGGNLKYISEIIDIDLEQRDTVEKLSAQGKTPLLFAGGDGLLGIIAVADTVREDSRAAIEQLKAMGISVVMLTGDNEKTARAIAATAGVDEVIADVLPDGKEQAVRSFQDRGRVAMVGDGINDAPALMRADMGIAIGAGTDIAIDAAQVVLMKSTISDVAAAIRLSRATLRNIKENLFWAFFYNVIGIPLAAGLWYPLFGLKLSPMFGALAMSLSSFCVVTNALRLNLFNIYDSTKDKKQKTHKKEKKKMENKKTMVIEGMMCGHCEARVKKALEAVDGVSAADVSHQNGTAVVTLSKDIPDDTLTAAVTAQDYVVKSVS